MAFFVHLLFLSLPGAMLAGCASSSVTAREIVPIYESPCAVYDAGAACDAPADESGAYVAAWTSLSCTDVCDALDEDEPGPLLACDPVHLALPNEDHAGFYVVSCTFESEPSQ